MQSDAVTPSFPGFKNTNALASNSPRNFSLRNATVKLRHQAITFVSAGTSTPDEFLPKREEREVFVADDSSDEEDPESLEEDFDEGTCQTNIVLETEIKMSETAMEHMKIESPKEVKDVADVNGKTDGTETPFFVVDTYGDPALTTRAGSKDKRPVARSPSPTPSNSSEEVVVFQGRNNPAPAVKAPTRTRYKEILTPAADGTYDARTIETSAVRIESQAEQMAAVQAVMGRSKHVVPTSQHNKPKPQPQPQPHNHHDPNQQYRVGPARQHSSAAIGWGAREASFQAEVAQDATWAPAPAGSWWKNKIKKPRPDLDLSESEKLAIDEKVRAPSKVMFVEPQAEKDTAATSEGTDSDEKGAEETIAALQAEASSARRSKRRARQALREQDETSSKTPAALSTPKRRGKRGRKKDNRQLRGPIEDSDDDEGDDSDAAYEDYVANLATQQVDGGNDDLFTATAHSTTLGPSLVVDGREIADDEVLHGHFDGMNDSDSSAEEVGPIGLDTDELDEMDLSNLESSELEDQLEYTEREQWEDEEDLRQRKRERMTDEQIAKLYAKQQELGIEGDELIIDNGEYLSMSEDVDGIGDVARARAGLAGITNLSLGRRSNKHGMRRRSNRGAQDFSFPDASALADTVEQYGENGFDIMDFDRPSLRPTKKGRKGNLPPELEALSDEDLRENMRTAWANDRRKKSAKKAEREDVRMQGLLGAAGKSGKADLSQKYPFGMTTAQIHDELRVFLEADEQQARSFPPMGKKDRKELHEIAAVLKLSSKSVGSGKGRFPVLTKTTRTRYTPALLGRAIDASSKGFLGHGGKTARKLSRQGAKGGFGSTAAAQLQNGEIVGAGAAELGKENFGHRLMEKMGWSKGMALGKEGEGRLQPVEQKVRIGTAGLG